MEKNHKIVTINMEISKFNKTQSQSPLVICKIKKFKELKIKI